MKKTIASCNYIQDCNLILYTLSTVEMFVMRPWLNYATSMGLGDIVWEMGIRNLA